MVKFPVPSKLLSFAVSVLCVAGLASGVSYLQSGSASVALAACTTSGATGAGSPSVEYPVAAPTGGNDARQIQAQIDAASANGGGNVTLKSGTYRIDQTIILASNVELSGAGKSQTIIRASSADISIIDTNGASNITLNGFAADANGNALNDTNATLDYTIKIRNSTNVIVQNLLTINPFSYSIVPDDATDFCIRDNDVQVDTSDKYNQLDGIHVEGGTKGDVVDNYVDDRYANALDGDDGLVAQGNRSSESYVTYEGNIVRGGNDGGCMQFALGPGDISHIVVKGNEFWGCPFGIRTGGYATSGSITDVVIDGNYIHNLVAGTGPNGAFPRGGNAIDLGGYLWPGQSASDNTVTNTFICSAGSVVAENGTETSNTRSVVGCSDSPTTQTPPPNLP